MHRVLSLRNHLQAIVDKDPEQEVQGLALPVLDAVLTEASRLLPAGDAVVEASRGLITPDTIAAGEPMRAVDLLLVADQLYQALKHANRHNEGPLIG
jgi:hypothetical protein